MTVWRSIVIGISLAAAGCVHGYGGCLWTQPVKHTLSGRVHFRSYPTPDGVDNVPVLTLDHEVYIYSPAQSFMCQPADQLQLVGISEFPESVVEDSHVMVQGRLFAAASSHDHTSFLMNVITLLPENASPRRPQE
jgi:hypothetical protein